MLKMHNPEKPKRNVASININDNVPTDSDNPVEAITNRLELVNDLFNQVLRYNNYFKFDAVDMSCFDKWPMSNVEDPIKVFGNLARQQAVLSDIQMIDYLLDAKYVLLDLSKAFANSVQAHDGHVFGILSEVPSTGKYSLTEIPRKASYIENKKHKGGFPAEEFEAFRKDAHLSQRKPFHTSLAARDRLANYLENYTK